MVLHSPCGVTDCWWNENKALLSMFQLRRMKNLITRNLTVCGWLVGSFSATLILTHAPLSVPSYVKTSKAQGQRQRPVRGSSARPLSVNETVVNTIECTAKYMGLVFLSKLIPFLFARSLPLKAVNTTLRFAAKIFFFFFSIRDFCMFIAVCVRKCFAPPGTLYATLP